MQDNQNTIETVAAYLYHNTALSMEDAHDAAVDIVTMSTSEATPERIADLRAADPDKYVTSALLMSLGYGNLGAESQQTVCISLSGRERDVVSNLMEEQGLSQQQVFVQALRSYQTDHERRKTGETVSWSGDAQRAKDFAGPLYDETVNQNQLEIQPDCRKWFYYPIMMPITEHGDGPASIGEDAKSVVFEVWDRYLNSHGSFTFLVDAINEAIRLNMNMVDTKNEESQTDKVEIGEDWTPIKEHDAPRDGTWILLRGRNAANYPMVPVVVRWSRKQGVLAWRDSVTDSDMSNLVQDVPPGSSADWRLLKWDNV